MVALIVDTGVAGRTTYLGRKNVFATFSCRQHEQGQVSPVAAGGRGSHTLLCQQLDTAAGIGETEVCKPGPVLAPPMPRCGMAAPEVSLKGAGGSYYCTCISCSGELPSPSVC